MLKSMLAAVAVLTASTTAHAEKQEETAYALSILPVLAATVGSIAVGPSTLETDPSLAVSVVAWTSMAALVVGPSLGHFYAGEGPTTGLGIRAAGIAVAIGGAALAESHEGASVAMFAAGMATFVVGIGWDFATVGKAVRRANKREPQRVTAIAPMVGPDTRGMSFATTF